MREYVYIRYYFVSLQMQTNFKYNVCSHDSVYENIFIFTANIYS